MLSASQSDLSKMAKRSALRAGNSILAITSGYVRTLPSSQSFDITSILIQLSLRKRRLERREGIA